MQDLENDGPNYIAQSCSVSIILSDDKIVSNNV